MARRPNSSNGAQANQRLAEAERLFRAGRGAQAYAHYSEVLKLEPRNARALHGAGQIARQSGRLDDAIKHFSKLLTVTEPNASLYAALASCYALSRKTDDAQRTIDKAIAIADETVGLRSSKAEFFSWAARHAEAQEVLRELLDEDADHPAFAVSLTHEAVAMGEIDKGIELLEKWSSVENIPPAELGVLQFRLASLKLAKGDHAGAWEAAERANATRPARFDMEQNEKAVDQIISSWPAEHKGKVPHASRESSITPVLLLGVPRSGVGLVEQILSQHPKAHAAGETQIVTRALAELTAQGAGSGQAAGQLRLDARVVDRVGGKITEHYRRLVPSAKRGASVVADSQILNFSQLGLISAFLPGAKVVRVLRDPADTAASCFLHTFLTQQSWSHDPAHIGCYFRSFERLSEHWKQAVDLEFFDLRYEDLVASPEQTIRGLLEFLGLDFDEACLAPQDSAPAVAIPGRDGITEPLDSRAVGRAKPFEAQLEPFRAAFAGEKPQPAESGS